MNSVIQKLENEVWFRLIKVVFLLLIFVCVVVIGFFGYATWPAKEIDVGRSYMICNSDNYGFFNFLLAHPAYLDNPVNASFVEEGNIQYTGTLSDTQILLAKFDCRDKSKDTPGMENLKIGDVVHPYSHYYDYANSLPQNYTFHLAYKHDPSLLSWTGTLLGLYLVLGFISFLAIRVFYYIAVGKFTI